MSTKRTSTSHKEDQQNGSELIKNRYLSSAGLEYNNNNSDGYNENRNMEVYHSNRTSLAAGGGLRSVAGCIPADSDHKVWK